MFGETHLSLPSKIFLLCCLISMYLHSCSHLCTFDHTVSPHEMHFFELKVQQKLCIFSRISANYLVHTDLSQNFYKSVVGILQSSSYAILCYYLCISCFWIFSACIWAMLFKEIPLFVEFWALIKITIAGWRMNFSLLGNWKQLYHIHKHFFKWLFHWY